MHVSQNEEYRFGGIAFWGLCWGPLKDGNYHMTNGRRWKTCEQLPPRLAWWKPVRALGNPNKPQGVQGPSAWISPGC